ncbi:hydrogenase expression/formation protein HypE [Chloroflexota bacterium]
MFMQDRVLLAHGSGGKLSHDLIEKSFVSTLSNPILNKLDDSAVFELGGSGRLAFTTDSYVVSPIFFPGGDIGKLAVCGTVNDLAMSGATPLYLSLSFIIEEGLLITDLEKIVGSVYQAAAEAGVKIVAGDTKVVDQGSADKLFINTSGVGVVPSGVDISGANARPGNKVIVSGTLGDHGIAIMSQREGLKFSSALKSDCAPLNQLVIEMLQGSRCINCLRDPTRGGLATSLNEIANQSGVGIEIEEKLILVRDEVRGACELLGLDPLYIANEGKLVAVVASADADKVLAKIRRTQYGHEAAIIGEVVNGHPGRVVIKTPYGSSRILDMLSGELLPRIC